MPLLPDIIDEHLDEAAFLVGQWTSPVWRSSLSLSQMRRSVESRLLAHLDGIAVGGEEVAAARLWPALRGADGAGGEAGVVEPKRRLTAAVALAESDVAGRAAALLALAAGDAEGGDVAAVIDRALEMASRPDLDETLRAALPDTPPARLPALLAVLAARRADPGRSLPAMLDARAPELVAAALRAGAAVRSEAVRPLVAYLLASTERLQRAAAIQVAVAWGMSAGWQACVDRARRGDPRLLPPIALFGGPAELPLVASALADPKRRELALWAMGFTGRPEAVDQVIPLLAGDDRAARLAGEVFSALTGVAIDDDLRRAPADRVEPDQSLVEEDPDEDEDEAEPAPPPRPDPADCLPLPAAGAVTAWWSAHRARFEPGRRYLRGQPYSPEAVHQALLHGPLHRFDVLAFELSVRSQGRVLIPRHRLGLQLPPASAFATVDFQAPPRWS